eukprot:TRINITY_DN2581_c0_g1_i3.p1 TRINITY_DN2581_c0_g1~~TRINITY_DN2581_c0_g1_i3.p1  ORF type:complete len:664 (+),score=143.07 TRINITY_DN2581_c0_g1_i3:34-2025(+)
MHKHQQIIFLFIADVVQGSVDASWFTIHPENMTVFWPEMEVLIESNVHVDFTLQINGNDVRSVADQSTAFNISETTVIKIAATVDGLDPDRIEIVYVYSKDESLSPLRPQPPTFITESNECWNSCDLELEHEWEDMFYEVDTGNGFVLNVNGIIHLECTLGVDKIVTIHARVYNDSFDVSDSVERSVIVYCNPLPPKISPSSGRYSGSLNVMLIPDPSTEMTIVSEYSLDSGISWKRFTKPVPLGITTAQVFKARSIRDIGGHVLISDEVSTQYVVTPWVRAPIVAPMSARFIGSVHFSLTHSLTTNCTYSVNGGAAIPNSGEVVILSFNETIAPEPTEMLVMASCTVDNVISQSTSRKYVLMPQVGNPVFAPEGGTYRQSIDVTIRCPHEDDELIRMEGLEVATISSQARILKTTNLSVFCRRNGWEDSTVQSKMYRILPAEIPTSPTLIIGGNEVRTVEDDDIQTFLENVTIHVVQIESDPSCHTYVSTDGHIPSITTEDLYQDHIVVSDGGKIRVQAFTHCNESGLSSPMVIEDVQVTHDISPTSVEIDPQPGNFFPETSFVVKNWEKDSTEKIYYCLSHDVSSCVWERYGHDMVTVQNTTNLFLKTETPEGYQSEPTLFASYEYDESLKLQPTTVPSIHRIHTMQTEWVQIDILRVFQS